MLGDKEEHFEGKGTDLGALQTHLEEYLKANGFTVQSSAPSEKGNVIQAKKGGFLREVVDAERAFTITITGSPADFTVRFGIGKWLENLGVAAIRDAAGLGTFLGCRRRRLPLEPRGRKQDHRRHEGLHRLTSRT